MVRIVSKYDDRQIKVDVSMGDLEITLSEHHGRGHGEDREQGDGATVFAYLTPEKVRELVDALEPYAAAPKADPTTFDQFTALAVGDRFVVSGGEYPRDPYYIFIKTGPRSLVRASRRGEEQFFADILARGAWPSWETDSYTQIYPYREESN